MIKIDSKTNYALLFPGQGSQYKGMLKGLENSPYLKEILPIANEICSVDFKELMTEDKNNQLNLTKYTQPALLITSYILWLHFKDFINHKNLQMPSYLAGHSLGEYSALVAAEVIDIEDAINLVFHRGQYMQESCADNVGAMAAILGIENEKVFELVTNYKNQNNDDGIIEIANYNALGQVVVSGSKNTITNFIDYAKTNGAKLATILPVSVAAHSSLMSDAALKLKVLLEKTRFNSPKYQVFSNVSAEIHDKNADTIKEFLFKQMTRSVRWVEIINNIHNLGVNNNIEIGVNNVLLKLNKRINKDISTFVFNDIKELECI